jgi:Cys-tRNA(Pro)/Cys-tRNA(Cys) deacylase
VRAFVEANGIRYRTHSHAPLVSFEEAKTVLPFDPNAMVKGLVFRTSGDAFAIVALRGADRADYKKIADALGIRRADLRRPIPPMSRRSWACSSAASCRSPSRARSS